MNSFETALSEATNSREVLGAIGLVVDRNGGTLYSHASGVQSLSPSAPPTSVDHTITLGSAGKFITHIVALQCVDRNMLSLDEPVGKWLPELDSLPVIEPSSEAETGFVLRPPTVKITLRHLLTHTSGIGGSDEPLVEKWRASPAGAAHAASVADAHVIVKLFAHPLLFEPGTRYSWGSSVYFTQLLVSRLTDQRLGEYVQANIFAPLGMANSTFMPQERADVREKLLQMMERIPDGSLIPFDQETRDVSVSVRDFAALFADLIAPTSKILRKESVNLLFAPQFEKGSRALADLRGEKEGEVYPVPSQLPDPVEVDGVPTLPVWVLEGKGLALNWTLAGLLVEGTHGLPLGMPQGTVTWNGMPNVVWAMHRERGVAMLFATQLIPVDDEKVVKLQLEFFKGAWATYGLNA
ncbi:protein kinase [Favolaschia claudopus]|uniref:Protein kinase n=1 Tax=Favolaschia claudopus TaxID=2862362 RepID=A0AAW0CAM2_9AGAR